VAIKVPTAEEIKKLLAVKAAGGPLLSAVEQVAMQQKHADLQSKYDKAMLQQRGKLSISEARTTLESLCIKHGIQPAEELLLMVKQKDKNGCALLTVDQRIKILSELLGYQMPKLKAVETHSLTDMNLTVVVRKFGDNVTEKMIKKAVQLQVEGEVVDG